MFWLTLILLLLLSLYFYIKYCHSYWERRNIPTLKPTFLVGNLYDTILGRENFSQSIAKCYKTFKKYKYVGYYKCLSPALIIIDPQLIGRVLDQDFNYFQNNSLEISEKDDILMAKSLFTLKSHQWKSIKALMNPMFSHGKLKLVYPLITRSCEKLVKYLYKRIENEENIGIDGKHLTFQYTTENVASCTFGIDANAFESETSEFVEVGGVFGTPSMIQTLKINIMFMIPALTKFISLSFFSKHAQNYLINLVNDTLRRRQEENIVRNDFLDMIGELKETSKAYKFDDNDIAAQAASFFSDGIETSSIAMSYTLFQIAVNPLVQDHLRKEIKTVIQQHNGEITYEALMEMNYLDCVIKETMRLNVPLMVMFKCCTKTYEFPAPIEGVPGIKVHPGDAIRIPVDAIHSDERHYPEPEKFKPERFDTNNRKNLYNYTYLPFGEGPRICVGLRFGILQIKAAIVYILMNFQVNVGKQMVVPLKMEPSTFLRSPEGGFWFDFEKIELLLTK